MTDHGIIQLHISELRHVASKFQVIRQTLVKSVVEQLLGRKGFQGRKKTFKPQDLENFLFRKSPPRQTRKQQLHVPDHPFQGGAARKFLPHHDWDTHCSYSIVACTMNIFSWSHGCFITVTGSHQHPVAAMTERKLKGILVRKRGRQNEWHGVIQSLNPDELYTQTKFRQELPLKALTRIGTCSARPFGTVPRGNTSLCCLPSGWDPPPAATTSHLVLCSGVSLCTWYICWVETENFSSLLVRQDPVTGATVYVLVLGFQDIFTAIQVPSFRQQWSSCQPY